MAKDKKGGSMKSPLFTGGSRQGEVAGPKGGKSIPDPLGYCGGKK